MGKPKDKVMEGWDMLSKWQKRLTIMVSLLVAISFLWGYATDAFTYYATSERLDTVENKAATIESVEAVNIMVAELRVEFDKGKLKERMEYLRDQIRYCKEDYGKDYKDANERQKGTCLDFEDERELKRKEWDKYFN